jgi:hypothetical protein
VAVLLAGALSGCDNDVTNPVDPRFGQVGEILIEIRSPVLGGLGVLEESLLWRSEGPWVLVERFGFDGRPGDETVRRPALNPGDLVNEYASLIRQLNETTGLRLFVDQVSQDLQPTCAGLRSRVTVTIRDTFRGEQARWVRCADGTLFTITPGSAGPDEGASRVVTAAQLTRSFTVGDNAFSTYLGSVPFYTLDRGEDSPARPTEPRAFRSPDGNAPEGWSQFWAAHAGAGTPEPGVDWNTQMVLLAAVGRRLEAGDSVKVLRILPIDQGTRIELVDRIPGDFCSPGAREGWPFHLVVAPRTAAPILFNDPIVERVSCGS